MKRSRRGSLPLDAFLEDGGAKARRPAAGNKETRDSKVAEIRREEFGASGGDDGDGSRGLMARHASGPEPAHPRATEALAFWWAVVCFEKAWRRALMPPAQVAYCVDCRFAEAIGCPAVDDMLPAVCISRDEVELILHDDTIALNAQLHEADTVNGVPLGTAATEAMKGGAAHDSVLTFVALREDDDERALFCVPAVGNCEPGVTEAALYGVILSSCRHAATFARRTARTIPAAERTAQAVAYFTIQARLRTLQMAEIYGGRATAAALIKCSSVLGSSRIWAIASCCASLAVATVDSDFVLRLVAEGREGTRGGRGQGNMAMHLGYCPPIVCAGTFEVFSRAEVAREIGVVQDLFAYMDRVSRAVLG